jgi:mannobiose 2-epimerase
MTTAADATLAALRLEVGRELTGHILPYWMRDAVDHTQGGFAGFIDGDGVVRPDAPKSSILNARILWTFSAAYRTLGAPDYAHMAGRAAVYLAAHFIDPSFGGVFWMLHADGRPMDDRKLVYAQAFAIYGLAEHYRAMGDDASLREAISIFTLVDAHAHDAAGGGYHEVFARDWTPIADARLGATDVDAPRSMNTHLHLLEAYTTLYRVWPNDVLRARIVELIERFLESIIAPNGRRLSPFFDVAWHPLSATASFGHDIEASWLLLEAADVVGDDALRGRVGRAASRLAAGVLDDGYDRVHGGLYTQRCDNGVLDPNKEWWPQAEGIVGFARAYEETGDERFLDAARATWEFTRDHICDRRGGEWRRSVHRDGTPSAGEKVGPWKCPYHNARACIEVMTRADMRAAAAVDGAS